MTSLGQDVVEARILGLLELFPVKEHVVDGEGWPDRCHEECIFGAIDLGVAVPGLSVVYGVACALQGRPSVLPGIP